MAPELHAERVAAGRAYRFEPEASDPRRQGASFVGASNRSALTSPSPNTTATATATASDAGIAVSVHEDAAGNDNENLNDEYVTLTNRGESPLDLEGWIVADEAGHRYEFGAVTLDPGASLRLHTGSGEDTGTDVYWGRSGAVWNNDGDTVTVRAANGTVVAERSY